MITEWEMYWLLKLDAVQTFLLCSGITATCFGLIGTLPAAAIWVEEGRTRAKTFFFGCCSVFCAGAALLIAATLCPTTKQMAMIKVIPAISNSDAIEKLKTDAVDLYRLGVKSAKDHIKNNR